MTVNSSLSSLYSCSFINVISLQKNTWYCNSDTDPAAIVRKRFNSTVEFLPQPSAILVGMDNADLLI